MSIGPHRVVIVGASAAGLSTAESLRTGGFDGSITLIGDETHMPYDRPPLSKQVLAGKWDPKRVQLRDESMLSALQADFRVGCRAVSVNQVTRTVRLANDSSVPYDSLVIATGVKPRTIPGTELLGVHVLRTLDHALTIRTELLAGPKVAVVGAGFLGAEVAAVARGMGLDVTIIDPLRSPMQRQLGDASGELVGRLHIAHGVHVKCGVGVHRFIDDGVRVAGVELSDGTTVQADLVLVAVGSVPATDWLTGSGVPLGNGVVCDQYCQAAPDVYAAGDVASWLDIRSGMQLRVEHRMNATEQAMTVAANILGKRRPFVPVPYFWSDQYDVRIQAYGMFPPDAEVRVVYGAHADQAFAAAYLQEGRILGILGWNCPPRTLRELRKHAVERTEWTQTAHNGEIIRTSCLESLSDVAAIKTTITDSGQSSLQQNERPSRSCYR